MQLSRKESMFVKVIVRQFLLLIPAQAVKNFAKDNGYVLVIGHSYKDKVSTAASHRLFSHAQLDVF